MNYPLSEFIRDCQTRVEIRSREERTMILSSTQLILGHRDVITQIAEPLFEIW